MVEVFVRKYPAGGMDAIRLLRERGRAVISDIAPVVVKSEGAVVEMSCKNGIDIVGNQPGVGPLSIGTISQALISRLALPMCLIF